MDDSEFSAEVDQINAFLLEYKEKLSLGVEFIPRTYNGITNLGLNIDLAKEELLALTFHNYDRGPVKDYNGDGEDVWEFGKDIDGVLVYIKIKMSSGRCKVLSFKESKGPFTLPYRNW